MKLRRVIITGIGSLGDLAPLRAVGESLRHRGTHVELVEWPERCLDPQLRQDLSVPGDSDMPVKFIDWVIMPHLARDASELKQRALDSHAEAIIGNHFCWAGRLAAAALGIPFVSCVVSPGLWRMNVHADGIRLCSWAAKIQEAARKNGLPSVIDPYALVERSGIELLLFQPEFLPHVEMEDRTPDLIGPCWNDTTTAGPDYWAWLWQQKRVCVVSFGTWVAPHWKQPLAELCVDTVLSNSEWSVLYLGDGAPAPRERLLCQEYVPMDLALAGAEAAIIHAGVGTLTQCLRWGIKTLCIPFCADQPYNAARAQEVMGAPTYSSFQPISREILTWLSMSFVAPAVRVTDHSEQAAQRILDFLK